MLKLREEKEAELQADIHAREMAAFPLVLAVPDITNGANTLVQAFGIGPLRANTVLLNWIEQLPQKTTETHKRRYGRHPQGRLSTR